MSKDNLSEEISSLTREQKLERVQNHRKEIAKLTERCNNKKGTYEIALRVQKLQKQISMLMEDIRPQLVFSV